MKNIYVSTSKGALVRAIVKKKTKEFSEDSQYSPPHLVAPLCIRTLTMMGRYHQAEKWQNTTKEYGPSEAELIEFEMYALITRNRLNNVVSKMGTLRSNVRWRRSFLTCVQRTGRVEATEREKVMEMLRKLMDDVLEQLQEDNPEGLKSLAATALTDLKRKLRAECKQLIVEYFKDIAAERKKQACK